jgi:hypothetical protein
MIAAESQDELGLLKGVLGTQTGGDGGSFAVQKGIAKGERPAANRPQGLPTGLPQRLPRAGPDAWAEEGARG